MCVSPHWSSHVTIDAPMWTGHYSSCTATWLALYMGCNPVILCGMDLYQGKQKYFYKTDKDSPVFHMPLDHHLRPWVEEARARLPHPERVRAASGPLVDVFGKYEGI